MVCWLQVYTYGLSRWLNSVHVLYTKVGSHLHRLDVWRCHSTDTLELGVAHSATLAVCQPCLAAALVLCGGLDLCCNLSSSVLRGLGLATLPSRRMHPRSGSVCSMRVASQTCLHQRKRRVRQHTVTNHRPSPSAAVIIPVSQVQSMTSNSSTSSGRQGTHHRVTPAQGLQTR